MIFLILFFSLALRFFFDWQLGSKFQPGQRIKLNYCLADQPFYSQNQQVFYYQNHFQKLKISLPLEPRFDFGDCLEIKGEIKESQSGFYLTDPKISYSQTTLKFKILKFLKKIGEKLGQVFLASLPYPEADLLSGIVLGTKQGFDSRFYQELRLTGTLHIVVASGYNLSVTAKKPVEYFAYIFGRKIALLIGFILVWFYIGLVGFEAPVVRAGIMISFLFLAQLLGRKYSQERALVFSAWLMLMFKPDLIASVSFQLSFAALIGIILGAKAFGKIAKFPLIGSDLAETLSAQIMVFPLIAWHFGRISWLAPFTNALILPLIPYIMALGLAGLFLGRVFLWLIYPFLWWLVVVIEKSSQIPLAETSLKINWWQTILAYGLIFWLLKRNEKKSLA